MATTTRLDIDLAFSLAEPDGQYGGERMQGTITTAGTDVEIFASRPELFLQTRTITLKEIRTLAADLAERGLSVALSGPNGLVVRLGAIPAHRLQRLLTGSAHVALGSRAALAPLLRRRRRAAGAEPAPVVTLPPSTLFPLVPTLDRRIRRTVTTTHYTRGSGRPRLIFVVGSENWDGTPPRQFDLMPETTTIGSSPDADLRLDGLSPSTPRSGMTRTTSTCSFPSGPSRRERSPRASTEVVRQRGPDSAHRRAHRTRAVADGVLPRGIRRSRSSVRRQGGRGTGVPEAAARAPDRSDAATGHTRAAGLLAAETRR
ncbi:hypothetical protein [Cryobacterium sp. 10C3]|uniref:hypothetical protein n=1 Tax=Cryobacterium sp. 10C3 TaxID=3048577 RepID=UPI002AB3394A|nr:hypothetical protein [Cryobacterium sp. 10C3]MDY7555638.1 hypothetical protein [Cryobacterium sp. 10C3]